MFLQGSQKTGGTKPFSTQLFTYIQHTANTSLYTYFLANFRKVIEQSFLTHLCLVSTHLVHQLSFSILLNIYDGTFLRKWLTPCRILIHLLLGRGYFELAIVYKGSSIQWFLNKLTEIGETREKQKKN